MEERFIRVPRTARYHVIGDAATAKRVWIVLHGYGQLARYFLHKFEGLQKDLLIVAPEGLARFYVDEGHRRVGATWMTREDRQHEIQDHVEYLDIIARTLSEQMKSDIPIGVLGFSQGVATACRWAMLGNTKFDKLVLWAGSLPLEMDGKALTSYFHKTHIDLVHGTNDHIVPASVIARISSLFDTIGTVYDLHRFDGGHELDTMILKKCLSVPEGLQL